jgi:beta-phosphoglucomutase-like phosphatase (HAD superfamily)
MRVAFCVKPDAGSVSFIGAMAPQKQENNYHLPHPQAIIFDCDGTLADTMPLHWRAWQVIARRHGFTLPEERFYSLGGVPARDVLKMLTAEQGLPLDPLAVAHEKEEEYLPLIDQVEPINTIVGIAREHYGKIPLAVASGGTRKIIEQVLEHLEIRDLFQAVVTSEDVVNQKPAPDIFLEAARRLGVPPQFCRGYEDTNLGMQAIRSAGMEAVDVRGLLVKREA